MVTLGLVQILHADTPRPVTIEATPFESVSLNEGALVLKLKGAWLIEGGQKVKAGAEIRIAPERPVKLVDRHTQILIRFQPNHGLLIDTSFDARSIGGKVERKLEVLAVK